MVQSLAERMPTYAEVLADVEYDELRPASVPSSVEVEYYEDEADKTDDDSHFLILTQIDGQYYYCGEGGGGSAGPN